MGIKLTGLEPKIDSNCTMLILGSFPSAKSLEMRQYYANPNNHFWEIIEKIFQIPIGIQYDEKIIRLNGANIALWDVIESCERVGSSDNAIKNEKPNDFIKLFKEYPKINHIILNGAKAEKIWKKWFEDQPKGETSGCKDIYIERFPSTSPRNPNREKKLFIWRRIKN